MKRVLRPHLAESVKLSPDPQFIDKVRDIVGLYLNPPDAAVVLCVDEKCRRTLKHVAPCTTKRDGPGETLHMTMGKPTISLTQ